jgi:uncharacterized protein (DUF433 family)
MRLAPVAELPPLREDPEGVWRVGRTRVTLDTVLHAYNNGASPEGIREAFDTLQLSDIYGVIAYYLRHRDEVDEYLRQVRELEEQMRLEGERRHPSAGLRERLLARRTRAEAA